MAGEEVAVFIDFENVRYGLLNQHGQEPDLRAIANKAKKYGLPTVMRAYADFSEHPAYLATQLHVAGIEAINTPVKRQTYSKGGTTQVRIKNAADMVLALDAVMEALHASESGKKKTFLLATGDRDYIKLVTLLRNRFDQRVVIAGVPGNVARDLVDAAGEEDQLEVPTAVAADMPAIKRKLVGLVRNRPASYGFMTLKLLDQWAQDPRNGVPGTAAQRRQAEDELLAEGVLSKQVRSDPKRGTINEVVLSDEKAKQLGYLE